MTQYGIRFGHVFTAALLALASASAHAACHPAPHSNVGCEFYAVTLPNSINQTSFAFSVRALNPSTTTAANLQISGGGLALPQSNPIAAGAVVDLTLPWVSTVSNSTGTVLVAGAAYHLVSDLPLSVVQFNADSGVSSSNDATLLLPVQNAGVSFRVNVWPEWSFSNTDEPAQVGVVATAASTTVQISGANLQTGAGLTASGGSAQMNAGDVLLLSSIASSSVDISGLQISADAPIVVYSAHPITYIPSDVGYGDHLEDSQPPLTELGQDYLLVRPADPSGGNGAKQYIKLLGTVDNTTLTFDPAVAGAPASLNAGQANAFEVLVDVHVHASQPIAVSQFMEGSQQFGAGNAGDPSQLTSIPSNRGALAVDFIAPAALAPNFAQVIAPTGAAVSIDGTDVTGWNGIGASGYSGANVALSSTDAHHATGDQPFTLSVYSYPADNQTSFWYAGGIGPSDDIFGDGLDN